MGNKLYVLGAGPGGKEYVTPDVMAAIRACSAVACAERYFDIVRSHPNVIEIKDFRETFEKIKEELKSGSAAFLLSGDTGIFSLLPLIKKNFPKEEIVVLPGISSLQILCARACEVWQDAVILSGHGRKICGTKVLDAAEHNRLVIFFCDAEKNPAWLCRLLDGAGLGSIEAFVGEKLASDDERISRGMASELAQNYFDGLSIVLLINEKHTERLPLLPEDADFIRSPDVPMTHEEVRAVITAKLRLTPNSVLWDLGAGSGSVSAAAAPFCREVHAVEINSSAAALILKNIDKLRLHNIKVYRGSALDAIDGLPSPSVVFIGGSGQELPALLKNIASLGQGIRVVVSAVSLKTIALCSQELSGDNFKNFDAVQIAASRIKTVGKTQIWQAQNPVVIFSAETCHERGDNK